MSHQSPACYNGFRDSGDPDCHGLHQPAWLHLLGFDSSDKSRVHRLKRSGEWILGRRKPAHHRCNKILGGLQITQRRGLRIKVMHACHPAAEMDRWDQPCCCCCWLQHLHYIRVLPMPEARCSLDPLSALLSALPPPIARCGFYLWCGVIMCFQFKVGGACTWLVEPEPCDWVLIARDNGKGSILHFPFYTWRLVLPRELTLGEDFPAGSINWHNFWRRDLAVWMNSQEIVITCCPVISPHPLSFGSVEDWTQGIVHASQVLCHWATSSAGHCS
jgi:hypothetical protein